MSYRVVDDYYRQQQFDFYRTYHSPFYGMSVELDITELKAWIDRHGYPTYLNLCYFIIRAMQDIEDFRYRWLDGRLVLYDRLDLGLTVPTPGGRFGFAYFDYDPDVARFNSRSAPLLTEAQRATRLNESERTNYVFFTALPKVAFASFTHAPRNDPLAGEPMAAFGKFFSRHGRLLVPVGLQFNHVFIDGRAAGEMLERTQELYRNPA